MRKQVQELAWQRYKLDCKALQIVLVRYMPLANFSGQGEHKGL